MDYYGQGGRKKAGVGRCDFRTDGQLIQAENAGGDRNEA